MKNKIVFTENCFLNADDHNGYPQPWCIGDEIAVATAPPPEQVFKICGIRSDGRLWVGGELYLEPEDCVISHPKE